MTSTTTDMYRELFECLRDSLHFNPGVVLTEFEKASRKVARRVWPLAEVKGWNFTQAVGRKARSFPELNAELRDNPTAAFALKQIYRLSLLPIRKVKSGRRAVKRFIVRHNLAHAFSDFWRYFNREWFHRTPPREWVIGDTEDRKSEFMEEFNDMLRRKLHLNSHPGPWQFLTKLQKVSLVSYDEYLTDQANALPVQIVNSKLTEVLKENTRLLLAGRIDAKKFLGVLARL